MRQNTPLGKENGVTIVIPVFNRENILGLTLESVLKQTYTNFRCIIVDDGSTDSSVALARKYENADVRFQVLENSTNSGACRCRNLGLALAESEYVVFLDSDDIWLPQFLETMLAALETANGFDAAACQAYIYEKEIGDKSGTRFVGVSSPITLERYLLEEVAWITSCMLWKTEAIRAIGGFADHLKMWQDWDLNVRYLGKGGKIIPVLHNLLYSKVGGHSQITNQFLSQSKIVKKFYARENSWNKISKSNLSEYIKKYFANEFQKFTVLFLIDKKINLSMRSLLLSLKIQKSPKVFYKLTIDFIQPPPKL